ncbi:MAG: 2-isopropylmalate synthase LeuA [Pseudomonadota bacterium]|jgi:2-isopropylmalate synthase
MDRLSSENDTSERRSPTAPPAGKYIQYSERFPLKLPDRTWPDKTITKAPAWCAVDLRDGNQALPRPMTVEEKAGFFDVLKKVGFTQIEVGYPAANREEYDFIRLLIEGKHIPSHVIPQVLTMDREDLIKKTFQSLKGVHQAIVHIYRPTSIDQRELFFKMTKDQVMQAAVDSTKLVRRLAAKVDFPVQLQFSPESFTGTEMEFALDVCNAVVNAWDPGSHEQVIINLPATVELSRPNIYADQIEWMSRNLKRRDQVILSLHNHNDRGTAVAATELGIQAGADRVEGTLFGNGERTGNLDLVNVAVNLYKEGIDPGIELSNIPWMTEQYEKFTGMKVPPRHVVGELAFTAFSGGHQAAIAPGLEYQKTAEAPLWRVPYLGVDPTDFGMEYEPIRLNAQSGKHGAAFCLKEKFGCEVPRGMLGDLVEMVKEWCVHNKEEIQADTVWRLFEKRYIEPAGEVQLQNYTLTRDGMKVKAFLEVSVAGSETKPVMGSGNGPIDAATNALKQLGYSFDVQSFHEHSRGEGSNAEAVAYVQVSSGDRSVFGVGIDPSTEHAALEALVAGLNRLT